VSVVTGNVLSEGQTKSASAKLPAGLFKKTTVTGKRRLTKRKALVPTQNDLLRFFDELGGSTVTWEVNNETQLHMRITSPDGTRRITRVLNLATLIADGTSITAQLMLQLKTAQRVFATLEEEL
tara:strand:- start:264 stop:635 length:372 start_codon:yes stop_codon:yes gene_type:complete